ncbi:flagellar protein FlaG [Chitinimonas sp.]|uniref:flagellar protein FlaG n=1 Tax=Chitinimonas sp. TaxID=1934313 RepID=UPI002F924F79
MQVQAVGVAPVQSSGTTHVDPQAVRVAVLGEQQPPVVSQDGVTHVTAAGKPEKVTEKQPSVEESVKKLNDTIATFNRSLQFSIDSDTRLNIVKVVDVNSKEVIRQIPSQEVVDIAKAIDKLQGLLLSDKA